jgi:hypothetical protein
MKLDEDTVKKSRGKVAVITLGILHSEQFVRLELHHFGPF